MNSDLARRSLQAVIWSYLGGGGKIVAQLLIQILLARMLGPAVFGQYAAVLVVIGFGWLFADSGFGAALVQKKVLSDDDVGYALGWVLLLSLVSGLVVSVLSPLIAQAMGEPDLSKPLMACGPIIVLQALSNLSASLMRRNLDMKRSQIIQLAAYILGFGLVAIVLADLGAGVWSLVVGFLVQTLIVLIFSYAVVRHTLIPRLRGDAELRSFGFGVLGTNLANWSIDNLDRFLIGRQWGIAALGSYAAASNLSRVPTSLLVASVQSVVFSSASRVQDEPEKLRRGYIAIASLTALLTLPLTMGLALKAEFIIHLLYGDRWNEAGTLFAAFCVALPSYVLLSVTGPTLWAIGAVGRELRVQVITAIVLLVGLLLLSGYPLAEAVWLLPCLYLMRFVLVYIALASRINLPLKEFLQGMFGGFILATLVAFIDSGSDYIFETPSNLKYVWELSQMILEAVACLVAIRISPRFMIGPNLSQMLLSRSIDSKLAKILCTLIALKGISP